jgi:hypothetical protein
MTSALKSATARANGAKSRGPATAAGLARSSKNSLPHGLTARHSVVLACEDPAEFEAFALNTSPPMPPRAPLSKPSSKKWRSLAGAFPGCGEIALFDAEMNSCTPEPGPVDGAAAHLAFAIHNLADESKSLTSSPATSPTWSVSTTVPTRTSASCSAIAAAPNLPALSPKSIVKHIRRNRRTKIRIEPKPPLTRIF